ncbi:hypothetical protein BGX33_011872, partial [Mortierella sp. NVP41]
MTSPFALAGQLLPVLHVEARLAPQCAVRYEVMRERIRAFLVSTTPSVSCFQEIDTMRQSEDELVRAFVERIQIGECSGSGSILRNQLRTRRGGVGGRETSRPGRLTKDDRDRIMLCPNESLWTALDYEEVSVATKDVELSIHVYQLQRQGAVEEFGSAGSGDLDESVMMAHHWSLPCEELEGVWDSLIFEERLQVRLLEYVYTTILFSDRNVNPHLVSWNRVVLLHGPPGTGKTSLCRGLAQKLAIRLSGRYRYTKLLEINSHSLFSKWFSESGKMVQRMFDQIWSMVDDEDTFVCVLIDEVESLAAARKSALSGNEPSDSIRVVNALLTQIDRLKKRKNVLILTTSNITEAIDIAFIDRADVKLYIGLPPPQAIYNILASSLNELWRAGIIRSNHPIPELRYTKHFSHSPDHAEVLSQISGLQQVSELAQGTSGRAIR